MPRKTGDEEYNSERFQSLLRDLLEKRDESYRAASRAAGLESSTVSRFMRGTRPTEYACIALAGHFGVHPNDVLEAAAYARLPLLDRALGGPHQLTPEVELMAARIETITEPTMRDNALKALNGLIDAFVEAQSELKATGASTQAAQSRTAREQA
jgi:transcriptional regulator with XRE-family HTH domain